MGPGNYRKKTSLIIQTKEMPLLPLE